MKFDSNYNGIMLEVHPNVGASTRRIKISNAALISTFQNWMEENMTRKPRSDCSYKRKRRRWHRKATAISNQHEATERRQYASKGYEEKDESNEDPDAEIVRISKPGFSTFDPEEIKVESLPVKKEDQRNYLRSLRNLPPI